MIFRRRRTRIEIEHTSIRLQTVPLVPEPAAREVEGMMAPKAEHSAYTALELSRATHVSQEPHK